jgi:hypothetical protein
MYTAVIEVISSLMPKDRFAIIVFNDKVRTLVSLTTVARGAQRFQDQVKGFACSGSTAFYDSVVLGLRAVASRDSPNDTNMPSYPHFIVVTDGQDTSSTTHSLNDVIDILKKPGDYCKNNGIDGSKFANFHASFITVGSETDLHYRAIKSIIDSCKKPNLHHFNAASAAEIGTCFRTVKTSMTVQRSYSVTATSTVAAGGGGAAPNTALLNGSRPGPATPNAAGGRGPYHGGRGAFSGGGGGGGGDNHGSRPATPNAAGGRGPYHGNPTASNHGGRGGSGWVKKK